MKEVKRGAEDCRRTGGKLAGYQVARIAPPKAVKAALQWLSIL
jgi:hypothetical protein